MRRSSPLFLSSVLLSTACGSDSDPAALDRTEGLGESETELTESGTAAGGGSGGDTSGETGSSDAPLLVDEPARAIRISRVEANPGVSVPVAVDGAWVDGTQRVAQLPKNRNTAFRVYVDVDDELWTTRPIEARITLSHADGTEAVYSTIADIAMDSSEASLQSNFLLGVPAEDMVPGVRFNVELFEVERGFETLPEVAAAPAAMPEPKLLGVEPSDQILHIMVVPIEYDFGGCSTQFDISDENLAKYEDAMFQQNPVESVEFEIHPYYRVDDLDLTGDGFFVLLSRIAELRASEAPDPNVYYYGMFDNCGECISEGGGCVLGVANGIPGPSMGEAAGRAAIGSQFLQSREVGIETFVHEIGHTQGRRHVECPYASASGVDPRYPHRDGKTGSWGFGVRDFEVRAPNTHYDYMSYCNPTWVSDWQWSETFLRIRELTSWDSVSVEDGLSERYVLTGSVNPQTGEAYWWTDRGWVDERDAKPNHRVRFGFADARVADSRVVDVLPWTEGPWVTVRTPLPEDFEGATEIRFDGPAYTVRSPVSAVRPHHRALRSLQ